MIFVVSAILYAVLIYFYKRPEQYRKMAFLPELNQGITSDRFIRLCLVTFGVLWGLALSVYSFKLIFAYPLK